MTPKELVLKGLKNPQKIPSYRMKKYRFHEYRTYPAQDYETIEDFLDTIESEIEMGFSSLPQKYSPGTISREDARAVYNIVREQKPNAIVETGVCNGLSTAVILKALKENETGTMQSIDLPDYADKEQEIEFWEGKGNAVIPPDKEPGWVIPDELRDNWNLILGDSNFRLPELLEEVEQIDMFIHDSEHSYRTMMLEYCLAWKSLTPGGLLISHDIGWNNAFDDFSEALKLTKYKKSGLGILIKSANGS